MANPSSTITAGNTVVLLLAAATGGTFARLFATYINCYGLRALSSCSKILLMHRFTSAANVDPNSSFKL